MENKSIKSIAIFAFFLNLSNTLVSFISNVILQNIVLKSPHLRKIANGYSALFTFFFGVTITILLIKSGIGELKNKEVDKLTKKAEEIL